MFEFYVWQGSMVAYDTLGHHIMASGNNTYAGVRGGNIELNTPGYKYIEFQDDEEFCEFYDLKNDPYELLNSIDTADPDIISHYKQRLENLRNCSGQQCW